MRVDDLRQEEEEGLEVLCPLDGHEAIVQLATWNGDREETAVVWCSRFGDEPVTCDQICVKA